ncbi:hypothetical protein [Hahella ganghwensis]|uniref:hypothetical protein n=1 Tax=Hahella ganghwensis TaxID=286420 RepID=UPI0003721333|nr:hypothetical protein [Hahella ganghwensis]
MVKRREPATAKKQPTPEEIEAFASGADGGSITPKQEEKPALDPNAKREFKAIRVPFNEYEYSKLEEVATKTGRTKLNVIRWAILKLAEEMQEGTK